MTVIASTTAFVVGRFMRGRLSYGYHDIDSGPPSNSIPPPRRPQNPEWKVGTQQQHSEKEDVCVVSSGRRTTTVVREEQQQRLRSLYQYVIHPVLLTTENPPQSVSVVVSSSCESIPLILDEITKHTSIHDVTIVLSSSGNDDGGGYDDNSKWKKNCIQQVLLVQQQHQERWFKPSIDCKTRDDALSSTVDVAMVLPNEDVRDQFIMDDAQYWYNHTSTDGVLVTYLGRTLSLGYLFDYDTDDYDDYDVVHPLQEQRWRNLKQLTDAKYKRIIDYDVPVMSPNTRGVGRRFPINIGVAFKKHPSIAYWRLNEPLYNLLWRERTTGTTTARNDDAHYNNLFDGATMMTILHPPKHSTIGYCSNKEYVKYGTCDFHGYDPQYPNVPLVEKLFVSKSKIGEHAGRGVFTTVDIPEGSNIGLETTVHSIVFDWVRTCVLLMSYFCAVDVENTP
jgi:hypothetical protein